FWLFCRYLLSATNLFYICSLLFDFCYLTYYFYTIDNNKRCTHVFKLHVTHVTILIRRIVANNVVIGFSNNHEYNEAKPAFLPNRRIQSSFFRYGMVFYCTLAVFAIFLGISNCSFLIRLHAACEI